MQTVDNRAFFRVHTVLPMRARVLDPAETEQAEGEIRAITTPDMSHIDPALASWLDRIETKLDAALEQIAPSPHDWITPGRLHEVMISGGGIRFPADRPVAAGTPLLIEFTLGGFPRRRVRATARTIRCEGDDANGHAIAAQFDVLSEQDRDAIVSFALEVQRAELRRRSDGEPVRS